MHWLEPGRLELRRLVLGRLEPHKQGSGKRLCCVLEMVLALEQERCGMDQQLLLGSGLWGYFWNQNLHLAKNQGAMIQRNLQ